MLLNGTWRQHKTLTSNKAHTGHTRSLDTEHVGQVHVHMTSGVLGEIFEGDFADICAECCLAVVDGGPSGVLHVCRHRSKDPNGHMCQRNFLKW